MILILTPFSSGLKKQETLLKAENPKRSQVQRIYTAELGVREKTGQNDGKRVEQYLRHVALKKGDPWCAAFVCWVFDQAGVANPQTGWAAALFPPEKLVWERRKVAGGKVAGGARPACFDLWQIHRGLRCA